METIRAERRLCSPSEFLVWFVQASRAVQAPPSRYDRDQR